MFPFLYVKIFSHRLFVFLVTAVITFLIPIRYTIHLEQYSLLHTEIRRKFPIKIIKSDCVYFALMLKVPFQAKNYCISSVCSRSKKYSFHKYFRKRLINDTLCDLSHSQFYIPLILYIYSHSILSLWTIIKLNLNQ